MLVAHRRGITYYTSATTSSSKMATPRGVFVLAMLMIYQRGTEGKFIATGTCSDESCLYSYSATLVKVMGGTESQLSVRTNLKAHCASVGTFGDLRASKFCIDLENTVISLQQGLNTEGQEEINQAANDLLKEPFCFIQTSDGKIVSVEHRPDERVSIVNLKKGIAAAFQGNFKRTAQEIEEDTQSKHVSHYRYQTIDEDHLIMYRTVDFENIIQFASNELNEQPANVQKSEVIEYKKGTLQGSRGTVQITVNGPVQSRKISHQSVDDDSVTYDESFGSNELSGTGKYSLKLEKCMKMASVARRSVNNPELTESKLHATLKTEKDGYSEMMQLRKDNPSIKPYLVGVHSNLSDISAGNVVRNLLRLESEAGSLPGAVPALTEVMDYLNQLSNSTNEKDTEMKVLLYSFLSAEGSIDAQKALLTAIQNTKDQKERNTLTVLLAFVANAHPDTLAQIETLIASSNDKTDTLILSYGALASSLSPQLQYQIVSFLRNHINQTTDHSILVHYIHSLGNTQSKMANRILLSLLSHSNPRVQLAAVYALRYSTGSVEVQNALLHTLESDHSNELTEMVLRAIIAGAESEAHPIGDMLFETILTASIGNSTELKMLLAYYIHLLGPKAPNSWSVLLHGHLVKRDTTWNEHNEIYNFIQDSSTRDADIRSYPINKAYIWAKSFGVSQVSLDAAFGAFAGFGGKANPTSYKLFAKGIARASAYGHSKTVFEALLNSENMPGGDHIDNRLYVSIVGKVLVDYSKQIPTCKTWTYPLYHSPTYELIKASTSVYIYVGELNFEIRLTANLAVDASLRACINKCVSAKGQLLPSVSVTAAADAKASLAEIVRGGISLTGSFTYQVTLELTGSYVLFKGPFKFCLRLLHGWPDNKISIFAYYQLRSVKMCNTDVSYPCGSNTCYKSVSYPCGVKMCKRWGVRYRCGVNTCEKSVPYPCGVKMCSKSVSFACGFNWSAKKKWDAVSKEWQLPSQSATTLWSSCDNKKLQCPAIAMD